MSQLSVSMRMLNKLLNTDVIEAVSLGEEIETNKELVAHGYSNLLAGVFGTVYVETLTIIHSHAYAYL